MIDISPWDLSPEQKAQLEAEWAEKVRTGQTRPRTCEVSNPAPAPAQPTTAANLSGDAAAWIADNPWINQQATRFNRTHFRPSVLRRGKVR